jgi:hypothetical protein
MKGFLMALALSLPIIAADRPAYVSISQWVREDLFAGFLANDLPRFEQGMRKVQDFLDKNPDESDALAWRGGGRLYLAVVALEKGERARFDELYAAAMADFDRSAAVRKPQEAAVYAVEGGTFVLFADRLPLSERKRANQRGFDAYSKLREIQKDIFAQLPIHMRGEVIAGLAQFAQRLGRDDARSRLEETITALAGSPYAKRAELWREKPEVAATSALACQSCHEPNRLANILSRNAAKP